MIADWYNIEMYSDVSKYKNGMENEDYYIKMSIIKFLLKTKKII